MPVERLILIQNGLSKSSGHWLQETQQWRKAALANSLQWLCLGNTALNPAVAKDNEVIAALPFRPYDLIDTPPNIQKLTSFLELSDMMRVALHQHLPADTSPRDLLLVAFTTPTEMLGVAKWLSFLPQDKRPRVAFMFHQIELIWDIDPIKLTVNGDFLHWEYAARAITQQVPKTHAAFFAAGNALVQVLSHIIKLPVRPMPLVATPHPITMPVLADRPYDIGVLGGARMEQGSQLWADIFISLLKKRPKIRALIQTQNAKEAQKLQTTLEPYTQNAKIDIIFDSLTATEYGKKLAKVGLVLLAYMPKRYCLRDSGVFTDAAGLGIPAVVSRYTLMEKAIREGRCIGNTFLYGDTEDTVNALIKTLDDLGSMTQKAQTLTQSHKDTHDACRILAAMIQSFPG